jgi:HAD superfamily hydrolase (TIGR01450 family)
MPERAATWVIDLDGVIWLSGEAIDGSAGAVEQLRSAGHRTVFATNNSSPTTSELIGRLGRIGIVADAADVVSSAEAAASLIEKGSTVLALAGDGVRHALEARSVRLVDEGPADVVVIGWTRDFDFERIARASRAVRAGARLIGTNEDATYPTPGGLLPGAGALLAAVATAAGIEPLVAGKPHRAMAELIAERAGAVERVVGDRPSTDGRLARRLGVPYSLVLSGVTGPYDDVGDPTPDSADEDLARLVRRILTS